MTQESVTWGVDWGKAGDIPCVSIIKRLPNGGIEVIAVEYAPYSYTSPPKRPWIGLNWDDLPEDHVGDKAFLQGAKWAEAKLREKNT